MTGNELAADEARSLLALSRRVLRMYDLTPREQQIAEVIVDWSYGFRVPRAEALIPEYRFFRALTGIGIPDISKTIKLMKAKQIVQVKPMGRDESGRQLFSYRFRPNAAWWQDAPCRVDVDEALDASAELDRINGFGPDVEPRRDGAEAGQGRIFKSENEDFDDGLTVASREAVLKVAAGTEPGAQREVAASVRLGAQPDQVPAAAIAGGHNPRDDAAGTKIGDSPTHGAIGKTPIVEGVGETPTGQRTCARTRATFCTSEQLNVQNVRGGAGSGTSRFADERKNAVLARIEKMCSRGAGYRHYWWVGNVRDYPTDLVVEALSDTEFYLKNNRCREAPGAVLWSYLEGLLLEHRIPIKGRSGVVKP